MVELIPGTSLPIADPPRPSSQTEGRGVVQLNADRHPQSLIAQPQEQPDLVEPQELAYIAAAVRRFDRQPRKLKTIFNNQAAQTDSNTGNCVIPLFLCPAGCEAHVAYVVADPVNSAIQANAGFANTATWSFLAAGPETTGLGNAAAASLRPGLIAFGPDPAGTATTAGVVLPFRWSFNDSNAPVLQSGDQLYYVLVGGSQLSIEGITINVTYRINLFGLENGQIGMAV